MFKKILGFFFRRSSKIKTDKLILVVDDGVVERKFMENTLAQAGYRVMTASNGEEGVKVARDIKPDVIFLDYSMPGGIDGQETCRRIKSEDYAKEIPVVFLSGSVSPSKVIDCYDVGAEYYLSKPISASTLLEHTRLLIEDAELSKKQSAQKKP
ncbi:MAG: response regulator [Candidatus Omnitrophica bacterium]|nr:response regulator [Candidatus Omnitrophota bacterium]